MRRLLWVGVGAVGAILLAERLRRTAHRYTPAGLTEQVEAAGRATTSALQSAVDRFRISMADRERDLVTTLLVTPEGGDPDAVFQRRGAGAGHQATDDDERGPWAQNASRPRTGRHADTGAPGGRPAGRVDDDEPLYDF